jgi:methylenetetrahydrofolate dehydrogenase (NADP+)/methenyltetrahydrofolate cyclohydrolase
LAEQLTTKLTQEIHSGHLQINLAVVLVGKDPASQLYTRLKKQACEKAGINFHLYQLPEDTTTEAVLEVINFLNHDQEINAILVQLPLPKQLDTKKIIEAIDPQKDADGFHPINIEKYLAADQPLAPALNQAIDALLKDTGENLSGKTVCILANSDEFAEPLQQNFINQGGLAYHTHLSEASWISLAKQADVLIVAVGQPFLITGDYLKTGAIIIDVGTNRLTDNVTVGDVDPESVKDKCAFLSPVPGGVGPLTVAMLLKNCVQLAKNNQKFPK